MKKSESKKRVMNLTWSRVLSITIICLDLLFLNRFVQAQALPEVTKTNKHSGFIPNRGQLANTDGELVPQIKYYTSGNMSWYFTQRGWHIVLSQVSCEDNTYNGLFDLNQAESAPMENLPTIRKHRVDVELVDVNPQAEIVAEQSMNHYYNYYYGHCPEGVTKVHPYETIRYKNAWPNIDIVFILKEQGIEYDFIVHPGGDPGQIALHYKGQDGLEQVEAGQLSIETPLGNIAEQVPAIYQPGNFYDENNQLFVDEQERLEMMGEANYLTGNYQVVGNEVRFLVGAYNPKMALVIDPWATFIGSSHGSEAAVGLTTSGDSLLITGYTFGADFPTVNAWQNTKGGNEGRADIFVTKFLPNGSGLIWSTFYGGQGADYGNAIAASSTGNISIVGTSYVVLLAGGVQLNDFPTGSIYVNGPIKSVADQDGGTFEGRDGVYVQLAMDGTRNYATLIGGSDEFDECIDVDIDWNDNALIVGRTRDSGLQMPFGVTPYDGTYRGAGNHTAFAMVFSSVCEHLWSTYYGGRFTYGVSITSDANNALILAGFTTSNSNIATPIAHQPAIAGSRDLFVAKFDANSGDPANPYSRAWATYFGGTEAEHVGFSHNDSPTSQFHIDTDSQNNIFMMATTRSDGLGTPGSYQPTRPVPGSTSQADNILVSFSQSGALRFATYLGGSGDEGEFGTGLAINSRDQVLVASGTSSNDMIWPNGAYQPNYSGDDFYMAKLSNDGSELICGTYFGAGITSFWDFNIDQRGFLYACGEGRVGFPAFSDEGAVYDNAPDGGDDAFVLKLCSPCGETADAALIADTSEVPVLYGDTIFMCLGDSAALIPGIDLTTSRGLQLYKQHELFDTITYEWTDRNTLGLVNGESYTSYISNTGDSLWIKPTAIGDIDIELAVSYGSCPVYKDIVISVIDAPTIATLPADATICPYDAPHNFSIDLLGAAPWEIKYVDIKNTADTITVNCAATPCNITAADSGCYSIVKLTDAACHTDYTDQQFCLNFYDLPTATIDIANGQDANICPGETVDLEVSFADGTADYGFSYQKDADPVIVIAPQANNPYTIAGVGAGTYTITEVTDANCSQTISEEITITEHPLPTLSITNPEHSNPDNTIWVCEGEDAVITFNYGGTGPFVVDSSSTNDGNIGAFNGGNLTVNKPGAYTFHNITDAHCSNTIDMIINVAYYPTPTLAFTADPNPICFGACTDLTFTMTGDGPFDVDFAAPNGGLNFSGQPNGHIINVCPTSTTNYEAISITDVHDCTVNLSVVEQVVVHELVDVISVSETCNNTNDKIQIVVTISGGVTPYNINFMDGPTSGTWDGSGTVWTSEWFNPGAYNLEFYDVNDCNRASVTGTHLCNCSTDAGTMNDLSEQALCEDQTTQPTHDGSQALDGNDIFSYILSDKAIPTVSTDVLVWSNNGLIGFDDTQMSCETTYYLLGIAGNNGMGEVDFNDPCLSLTESIPVRWRTYPDGNFEDVDFSACIGTNINTNVLLSGCVNNYDYTITAPGTNGNGVAGVDAQSFVMPVSNVSLNLTNVQYNNAPACPQTINKTLNITALDSPSLVNVSEACNATSDAIQITVTLTGGDKNTYDVNYISGISNGSFGANPNEHIWTSEWFPPGSYEIAFYDANQCNTVNVAGSHACNCATSAGDIDISPIEVCENDQIIIQELNAWTNDGNDTLEYVLHSSATLAGNWSQVLDRNTSGVFDQKDRDCNTIYYVTRVAANDDGNGQVDQADACISYTGAVEVKWRCSPSLTYTASTAVCEGKEDTLRFNFSGGHDTTKYDVSIDGVLYDEQTSPFELPVTIHSDTTFTVDSLRYWGLPFCTQILNEQINIGILTTPDTSGFIITCDGTNQNYVVEFNMVGGVSSYIVNGLSGNFTGNRFISDPLTSGSTYDFYVSDTNKCDSIHITGIFSCNCTSSAGTISVPQFELCEDAPSFNVVHAGDSVFDANDIGNYYLHTDINDPIGTSVADDKDGTISFLPVMNCEQTYFLTYVVGNNSGSGNHPEGSDPCLSFSNTDSVIWHCLPNVDLSMIPNDSLCLGNSGAIKLNFTSGVAPYVLQWDLGPSTGLKSGDSLQVAPNTTTTYTFTGISDQHCAQNISEQITITYPQPFSIDSTINLISCHDSIDGELSVQVSGGYGGYTYQWYDHISNTPIAGETGPIYSNAGPGTYRVEIQDKLACNANKILSLNNPPAFKLNLDSIKNEFCFRDSSGFIQVSANNGDIDNLFSPGWNNVQGDSVFIDVHYKPGLNQYTISATDVNGCEASKTFDFVGLHPLTLQVTNDVDLCPGETADMEAQASGGNVGGYEYYWNEVERGTDYSFVPLGDSVISVYALDANKCPSETKQITLNLPDEIQLLLNMDETAVCPGDSLVLSANVFGGAGLLANRWEDPNGATLTTSTEIKFAPSLSGNYVFTSTDTCGSSVSDLVSVNIPAPLDVNFTTSSSEGCVPHTASFVNITTDEFENQSWDFGEGGSVGKNSVEQNEWELPGTYIVRLTLEDEAGCLYDQTDTIIALQQTVADFVLNPRQLEGFDSQVRVYNNSQYANSYEWEVDSLGRFDDFEPILNFPPNKEGAYEICLRVNNAANCPDRICKTIRVKEENNVFVPNFFTPNQDEINDGFVPVLSSLAVEQYEFSVYNRWGELLFKSETPGQAWDGTFKGVESPSDTYTWKLKIRFTQDIKIQLFTGVVTLGR